MILHHFAAVTFIFVTLHSVIVMAAVYRMLLVLPAYLVFTRLLIY